MCSFLLELSRAREGSSRSQEEGDLLRGSDSAMKTDPLCARNKWNNSSCEDETKGSYTKSSVNLSTPRKRQRDLHIFSPSEDEDVCPTYLEEYTSENPNIITKCSHHFHLGCIYEWMERSENCPVCGKVNSYYVCLCSCKVIEPKMTSNWGPTRKEMNMIICM
ncbi:putative transcription factor C2H2 family [Helianthus anomalus]